MQDNEREQLDELRDEASKLRVELADAGKLNDKLFKKLTKGLKKAQMMDIEIRKCHKEHCEYTQEIQ